MGPGVVIKLGQPVGGKHTADGMAECYQLGAVAPPPALLFSLCTTASAVAVTITAAAGAPVGATTASCQGQEGAGPFIIQKHLWPPNLYAKRLLLPARAAAQRNERGPTQRQQQPGQAATQGKLGVGTSPGGSCV